MELLLFILPVFFALSVLFLPATIVRLYGIIGAVASLIIAGLIVVNYNASEGEIYYFSSGEFLPAFQLTKNFGFDGIGAMMILLTNAIIPLILLTNFKKELAHSKQFTALVFFMQLGLLGVFTALDGLWFYTSWEVTLIPIFMIAYLYGAPERKAALMKFFVYTFVGSIAMLATFFYLGTKTESYSWENLVNIEFNDAKTAAFAMLGVFIAFAVKIPIFPFHTWQPDTYSKAPMAGTMLLSGIMLKMALYGILRWLLPLFPEALCCKSWVIITLGIIGVVYGAILAIKQNDMKRLFAFASISHVGLIAAGMFTLEADTVSGAVLQMINHALVAVGLFLAADIFERRAGTRNLSELGGIAKQAPNFAFWFMALSFAAVSVPFSAGFMGEFLLLKGLYSYNWIIGLVAGLTLILGAVYTFRAYQLSMNGPVKLASFEDLHWSEMLSFVLILSTVVILGIFPSAVIDFVKPSVNHLLEIVNHSTYCIK